MRRVTIVELAVVGGLIGGVVGLMFLRALVAIREKARLSACANNLDQISQAIEIYLGHFGDYYPGHLSWDPEPPGEKTGLYRQCWLDWQAKPPVRVRPYVNGTVNPAYLHWAIGTGHVGGYNAKLPGADDPKVAPLNLGLLLATDCLRDEKALYCPSGLDVRHPAYKLYQVNDTLADWKEARSRAATQNPANVLISGRWPRETNVPPGKGGNSRYYAVGSQYGYRNAAIFCRYELADQQDYASLRDPITIAYTRPRVVSSVGCPPFKTPRQLAGRALVCDDFYKADPNGDFLTKGDKFAPGWGNQFHRDGYLVLSGSYGTRWYGDPAQSLIYYETAGLDDDCGGALGNTWHWVGSVTGGAPRTNALFGTPLIWHYMDWWVGVDLNADNGR